MLLHYRRVRAGDGVAAVGNRMKAPEGTRARKGGQAADAETDLGYPESLAYD